MDLAYMAALPQEEFTERRQKVFAQMQPNSALLLFSFPSRQLLLVFNGI